MPDKKTSTFNASDGAKFGSRVSRRDFLRAAGASGLVVAAGPSLVREGVGAAESTAHKIRRGGTFRVGIIGGSGSSEVLDPNGLTPNDLAIYRVQNTFSKLTDLDDAGNYVPQLAESLEANKNASEWTVRLKSGVEWHDGSDLTADDVIYSFQRVLNPKNAATLSAAAGDITMVDPKGMKKLDKRTVRFKLKYPWAAFPAQVGQRYNSIVKSGTTHFSVKNYNGTGPFKLVSWSPGNGFVLEKNPNYFVSGKPYVHEVHGISIVDPSARLDALLSKEVDAIEQLATADARTVTARGMKLLVGPAGAWDPIVMDTRKAPFTHPRVREAMKLLADRHLMIESSLQGYGQVGNDLFAIHDTLYDHSIPQRHFDPDRAKSLLKAAGYLDHEFVLYTAAVVPDFVPSALVLEQSAAKAGIKLKVRSVSADSYWSSVYGVDSFDYSSWGYRTFFPQWVQSYVSYNVDETNWKDASAATANKLVKEAASTTDVARQRRLAGDAQKLQWSDGGYLIWGLKNQLDAHSPAVRGLKGNPFMGLGWLPWDSVWIS